MSNNVDPKLELASEVLPVGKDSDVHPLGIGIGAATGAVAGQSAAELLDPAVEDAYWSEAYGKREYASRDTPYTEYQPAFRYGWESHARFGRQAFHEVETELERGWEAAKGKSKLAWAQAKHATRDAWNRLNCSKPADASCGCH